ncbi:hypothetical protein [Sinorhizobium chiapasense]|uniref:DUF1127 domain-containing protein n=1 Tax=Sinorhizobium chiapasense TaxID=501572 RepID=A0ABZ2BE16_9HYPH
MDDTTTLAPAPHQATRPGTPVGPEKASRRHDGPASLRAVVAPRDQRKRLRGNLEQKSKANLHPVDDVGRTTVDSEVAKPLAGHTSGLLRLLARLSTLAIRWRTWGGSPAVGIDDLSDAQLRELGISRVARSVRWLDGCETQLPMDFEYSIHPDVTRGDERYCMSP